MYLLDWLVLAALLLGPTALGTWRGWWRGWWRGPQPEEPQGAKSLGVLTVGLSLLASNLSGITLLGYPAEVYRYGSQFCLIAVGAVLATAVLCVAYLPVLHGLRLRSSYEYLELRFDGRVRKLTSVMYTGRMLLLLPLVLYVPALAFNQVTGVSIHIVAPVISSVCILYTTLGGLRAVAMTGSLQLLVMLVATAALLGAGLVDVGGPARVWSRMEQSGRLEFLNLDPNPLTRTTLWSAALGGSCFWLQMLAVQPNSVQRYLAVPTLSAARRTAYLQCGGLVVTTALTCYLGAVMFTKYFDCDPLSTKEVQRADQLVAYMAAQSRIPGLAGLFLAGLLSGAMGNLSAALNTLSGTLYADLVSVWMPQGCCAGPGLVTRAIGVLVGLWATLMVFVVERLGGLVQVAMSLGSVTSGTTLGLFTLGMLVPRANALGALAGAAVSLLVTSWVAGGQQAAIAAGVLSWPTKPTSVAGCNATAVHAGSAPEVVAVSPVLRLSYLWLVLLGAVLTLVAGTLVSLAADKTPVDPSLLFSFRARHRSEQGKQGEMDVIVPEKPDGGKTEC